MTVTLLAAFAALVAVAATGSMDTRIRQSADASQTLQGPLDGAWTLRDATGRALFVFQLSDPVGGGALGGAWRDARDPATGPAALTTISRTGARLALTFGAPARRLSLHFVGPAMWRGYLSDAGLGQPVRLARN